MRTVRTWYAVTVALAVAPALFAGIAMPPAECGKCHVRDYDRWKRSVHQRVNVGCADCHGELHSARLEGCRQCHAGKHDAMFDQWTDIKQFDPPNSGDYLCSVCHDPHQTKLNDNMQGCTTCHLNRPYEHVVALHTGPIERLMPTENDGYVLRQSLPVRLARGNVSNVKLGLALLALSIPVFLAGTLAVFPLTLGLTILFHRTREP